MRKTLFTLTMILGLLAAPMILRAQTNANNEDSPKKMLRFFLNTGEMMDFDAAEIDSITTDIQTQMIWSFGECTTIDLATIDSICYITPTLRISAKELNFGKVAVGNSKTQSFCITNTGNYPETYFVMLDGVFSVEESGQDICLEPGEAKNVNLTFQPKENKSYNGEMSLSSFSAENGLLVLPLAGKGVENDSDEEFVYQEPSETEVEVVLPADIPEEQLGGFKIINSNGEFPVNTSSIPSRIRKVKSTDGLDTPELVFPATAWTSNNGMQLNFLANKWNTPLALSWSFPGENLMEMSPERTAIALLMTEPLLITTNQAEFNNIVKTVKSKRFADVWKPYVSDVTYLYMQGVRQGLCPDYSSITSAKQVIFKLMREVYDNHELELSGVSLDDFSRTPEAAIFRLHNNYKRIIHAYNSRVKMNEANTLVVEREDANLTLVELCEWLLTSSDLVENELSKEKNKEEIEFIEDFKEWIGDIEDFLVDLGLWDADSHLSLPIILDSGHANYWKIVKGSLQGETSSIYEVVSDEIKTEFKNPNNPDSEEFDKIFVDIYGMGRFDGNWDDYSKKDKFRIAFALIHSAYKDFLRPLIELAIGGQKMLDTWGIDDYHYDFRYGKRKLPEIALAKKLAIDFFSEVDNWTTLYNNIKNRDLWEIVKQLTVFMYETLCTIPNELASGNPDDKRTYTNLIYNIYKKWSGNSATSKKFRDKFKEVANELTYLKKANFIGKTINVAEYGLDLGNAIKAFQRSTVKNTFVIDRADHPYITVSQPETFQRMMTGNIHFKWDVYKAKNFGQFKYDMVLNIETPNKKFNVDVFKNLEEKEYEINLGNLLSSNNASDAIQVKYQIIAHHPENPSAIYASTDVEILATLIPINMPLFVDLGLPSGTRWANCNFGADNNNQTGNYFAWGETTGYDNGKTDFSWSNYKYCQGTSTSLLKYCTKSNYGNKGFTDDIIEMEGGDDPVTRIYGYDISIPTKEQWEELMTCCNWTYDYALKGFKVSGKFGLWQKNSIFLPAAGYRQGTSLFDKGTEGYYWSSTLDENSPDDAWFLYFGNGKRENFDYYRCYGRSIRPVLNTKKSDSQQNAPHKAPDTKQQAPAEIHSNGMVVKTMSRSTATQ